MREQMKLNSESNNFMRRMDDDILAIMKRRVYDTAATTGDNVKVFYNGRELKEVRNFGDYVGLFRSSFPSTSPGPIVHEISGNGRWEVFIGLSEKQF